MGIVAAVAGRMGRAGHRQAELGWRMGTRLCLMAAAMSVLVGLSALILQPSAAMAERVHPLEVTETLPNGGLPSAVAVNSTTHHFYVVASVGEGTHVYNFEANGQLDAAHPQLTGGALPEPTRVAVDNSGGSHEGYIYALNRVSLTNPVGSVQQFDPQGEAASVNIHEETLPANGTPQAGGLPPVVNKGTFEPRNVAVDASGNVYVTDTSAMAIDVFTPDGEFVRQIAAALSIRFPEGIAIEGPNVFIALAGTDGAGKVVGPGLVELSAATGECIPVDCTPVDSAPIRAVASDQAAGTVYTTAVISEAHGSEGKFSEYEASTGDLLGVTHPKELHSPQGIAVDEVSGDVIVMDRQPEGTVKIFGGVQVVPDVTTLPAETVTDRSATLKGEIGAAGISGATCVFQYVDREAFEAEGFEGATEVPCAPEGPFSGDAINQVKAEVDGLRGGTTYHARIVGTNAEGSASGEDIPFLTKGPTVAGTAAVGVTDTSATLKGTVDPNGSPTTYQFQYLTQAQWEASGWAGATEVPAEAANIGSGTSPVPVSAPIAGLASGTAYRFRIFAVSPSGTTEGLEVEFTVQTSPPSFGNCPNETFRLGKPSAVLPDCRAYEQASPVVKNGANIQGAIDSVQASLDGGRITFFSNAGIPGGEGAQQFPTFMAERSPEGWSTQGLLPPASYGPRAEVLGWTEDLADTYDFAAQPFEGGSLLRRQTPTGPVTVAGTIAAPQNPLAYAGSSQGGAVALLESRLGGLKDAAGNPIGDLAGKQNVYAYDRGSGSLVVAGVLNDGTVPPEGAMAGPYAWFGHGTTPTTEAGGAIGHYYTQAGHAISDDGSEIFFTAGGTGQLYVRLNPLATQSAMAAGACTEAAKACTVRVSAPAAGVSTDPETPAAFVGASADGRLVYFLDKGKLTTDATGGSGFDLYRYDVAGGSLTDLTVDTTDRNGARVRGMLGIGGPNGEDAYFVADGKLAGGTTQTQAGETNLYALHDSTIEFVTRLGTSQGEGGEQINWVPTSEKFGEGNPVAHAARVSADGRTLLFSSLRNLTSYKSHGKAELYLFGVGQGIHCVSCNPSGEAPTGSAGVQQVPQITFVATRTYSIMTRNLSADAGRVFFDSPDRLVSTDHNDVNDVYEWEADGEGSCASGAQNGGCLFLVSGGAAGGGPSWFGDADETGENAFFLTAQPLVPQDRDELVDVYDARVGGGIADQNPPAPAPPCEGEAGCRGAAPPPPAEPPGPGSSLFQGPGNPKQGSCPKGKVKKHGKCVKKPAHKKHKGKKSGHKSSKKKAGKGKKGGKA